MASENNDDSTFSFSTSTLPSWFSYSNQLNFLQSLLIPDFHWNSFILYIMFALGKVIINSKNFLLLFFLAFLLKIRLDKNYQHYCLYKISA